jgi:hypothetical protein
VGVVALAWLLSASSGWACSCATVGPGPCKGLKGSIIFVGTVTDEVDMSSEESGWSFGSMRYRFRVDERIVGMEENWVEVRTGRGGGDCGFPFEKGSAYLVFAHRGNDGKLYTSLCSSTRPVEAADALLPQLRAMRDGERVANLYGQLWQRQQPYESIAIKDFDRRLANTRIFLRSDERSFDVLTDSRGVYAFYDIPKGKYRFEADVPAGLRIAQTILAEPPEPLEMPANACYEYDVDVLPTASIRGRVLGPDGNPLRIARVGIYRKELYSPDRVGARIWGTAYMYWAYQDQDQDYFEFHHLAPGSYILVFNDEDEQDPDMPFPRTFYPGVTDWRLAAIITLTDGQQFLDADIRVSGEIPTREIFVRVFWNGKPPAEEESVNLAVSIAGGNRPDVVGAKEISPGVYRVRLFRQETYQFVAWKACFNADDQNSGFTEDPRTERKIVRGDDDKTSLITLAYSGPSCPRECND